MVRETATGEDRVPPVESPSEPASPERVMVQGGLLSTLTLLLVPFALAADGTGVICGTVFHRGQVPPPVRVPESQSVRHLVKRDRDGHLAEAVVWLEGEELETREGAAREYVVDQVDYFFVPNVLAIRDGDRVQFLNSDGANHGVIGESTLAENMFNIVVPPGGRYVHRFRVSTLARRMGRPTLVRLRCPIHAAMSGWIVVFPHPYYAVTAKDGRFCIAHAPPGSWRLKVLHPDTGLSYTREVEVVPGGRIELQIVLRGAGGQRDGSASGRE